MCVCVCVCVCSGMVDLLFHITPSTGDDVHKKYIYLDLHVLLAKEVIISVVIVVSF